MRVGDLPCFANINLEQPLADLETEYMLPDPDDLPIESFGLCVQDERWRLVQDVMNANRERISALEVIIDNFWVVSGCGNSNLDFSGPGHTSFYRHFSIPFHRDYTDASAKKMFRVLKVNHLEGASPGDCTTFVPVGPYIQTVKSVFTRQLSDALSLSRWKKWIGNESSLCTEAARMNTNLQRHVPDQQTGVAINKIRRHMQNQETAPAKKLWQSLEATGMLIHAPAGNGFYSAWTDLYSVHGINKIVAPGYGSAKDFYRHGIS